MTFLPSTGLVAPGSTHTSSTGPDVLIAGEDRGGYDRTNRFPYLFAGSRL